VSDSPSDRAAAAKAAGLFEDACAAGSPIGCSLGAGMFKKGIFVDQDLPRATRLHEQAVRLFDEAAQADARACDSGDGKACAQAGERYEQGGGLGEAWKHHPAAAAWYAKA